LKGLGITSAPLFRAIIPVVSVLPSSKTKTQLVYFFTFLITLAIVFSSFFAGIPIIIFGLSNMLLMYFILMFKVKLIHMSQYKYWKAIEYKIAEKFKNAGFVAKRLPLSRNVMEETSEDVIVPDLKLIIDVKSTIGKKSIRLEREPLENIQEDAKKKEQTGAVVFSFKGDKNQYLILNLDDFFKFVKS